MDNKLLALLLIAGAAGVYLYTQSSTNGGGPPGGNYVPPGGSYGGYTNNTGTAQIITASGDILDALGNFLGNILPYVTTPPKDNSGDSDNTDWVDDWLDPCWNGVAFICGKPKVGNYWVPQGGLM